MAATNKATRAAETVPNFLVVNIGIDIVGP
jgi:hypothetical protein